MGLLKYLSRGYFDECAREISAQGVEDPDSYDEGNEVNHPGNPIWEGSEIHITPYGSDPTLPDPNEVNQD
jgi:hypothetical protein